MVKITVLIPHPTDLERFNQHYYSVHVPIVQSLPNVKNIVIQKIFNQSEGIDENLFLLAQFEFENEDIMNDALSSPAGELLYGDVSNLLKYLPEAPKVVFSR